MKNAEKNRKQINDMLLVFSLFLDEGIIAVERIFPEYKQFILAHKDKSLSLLKKELGLLLPV
ncbi:hypothetical protein [Chitinophaga nivalis]|uniref:Uncharacterized protein n=1 Tax=Chitinophaga nivalis TaxID=2991709 RepID=A0ABT3IXM3_9BACT|nr:hypothetical protein [Chitinophaga nivalis]MCW3461822.1 hypothetical protein [Chitinophaga nivalis]MCW3488484.1 hypothetical protein [Chitinophaga nivalis]